MAKFTKVRETAFKEIALNAGILVDTFTPDTGEFENIIGATSGGIEFKAEPEYTDFGEDIDNCPKNTMELKRLDSITATLSGEFATVTADLAARLVGPADVTKETGVSKITPRTDLKTSDFKDIWLLSDYGADNTEETGGFIAVHMMNGLSTGGFGITTADKEKGKFSFEFTGHYTLAEQSKVPFEIYISDAASAAAASYSAPKSTTTETE